MAHPRGASRTSGHNAPAVPVLFFFAISTCLVRLFLLLPSVALPPPSCLFFQGRFHPSSTSVPHFPARSFPAPLSVPPRSPQKTNSTHVAMGWLTGALHVGTRPGQSPARDLRDPHSSSSLRGVFFFFNPSVVPRRCSQPRPHLRASQRLFSPLPLPSPPLRVPFTTIAFSPRICRIFLSRSHRFLLSHSSLLQCTCPRDAPPVCAPSPPPS